MNRLPVVDPSQATPFAGLTPAVVLDALDSVGLRGDGRLLQLNSYENRVFQVFLEDGGAVVAKFYRPGRWSDDQILEEHRFAAELSAEDIPVVAALELRAVDDSPLQPVVSNDPPTLGRVQADGQVHRFSVSPCRSGRGPVLEAAADFEWLGRFIGRIHAVGARRPFAWRKTFGLEEFGVAARDRLWDSGIVPPHAAGPWRAAADEVLDRARAAFDQAGPLATIRLHGDCHVGNVLWTDAGPHFVDLDDAINGYAVQDLWMLLSGDPTASRSQLSSLLAGYELFCDYDDRQTRLIEPLRGLRMIYYSGWIAQRWEDPAFPAAFPWFGEAAYWQQQAHDLRDQAVRMAAARSP